MKWFNRKRPPRGAFVIGFDCRGCMADDHRFQWIGTITGFTPNQHAPESAEVKIIKRGERAGDSRDRDMGWERPVWGNGAFQKIVPGLYFFYT